VVTWYRYGDTPEAVAVRRGGERRRLPLHREDGALRFELDGGDAAETERIEVRWPSGHLRQTVLIDTPGIESATDAVSERARDLLIRDRVGPGDADALVYLLRHLHTSDLSFLESFRDTAAGSGGTVGALAVLSRADEVGAGRLDAMLSARRIAERYRAADALRPLALTVLPVAGLLAETARTLREREFSGIRAVSRLDRPTREALLLSVDRFVRGAGLDLSEPDRKALVSRFGISGIRLASALVRGGASTSQRLSEQMLQQSGLEELQETLARTLVPRQDALKLRALLTALDDLATTRRQPAPLRAAIERVEATSRDLRELDLVSRMRGGALGFGRDEAVEAEQIAGARGVRPVERLGLPDAADDGRIRARAEQLLDGWRRRAQSPSATRPVVRACADVVRTLEGILSEVAARSGRSGGTAPDVDTAGGPADGAGQHGEQQRDDAERTLQRDDQGERRRFRARLGQLEPEPQHERQ
ncbi:MAG TPA: GTP-binding protein, partial [Microbacterium sp.]|nr:GTP-binding protein [Microbacterium sp.]